MPIPLPWRAKLILKLVLSRLPIPYRAWKSIRLFQHGKMDTCDYALGVYRKHHDTASPIAPFTALELGPGDSLVSALLAKAHGATRIWLVDAGEFATRDLGIYREMAQRLNAMGLRVPLGWTSREDMLEACGAVYLTGGLRSLREIPTGSVDFIWSQAVLEHVRLHEFRETFAQLRRCLKEDGIMTHQIDLNDHLGDGLNNLRFTERRWESAAWVRSGFYTNRLRYQDIMACLAEHGFESETLAVSRWPSLPTPRSAMDAKFQSISEEDLKVKDFFIRCRPLAKEIWP